MKSCILLTLLLVLSGCVYDHKQEHAVSSNGTESGVKIKVLLANGGFATLVCPLFKTQPRGIHGRECYLDNYDK